MAVDTSMVPINPAGSSQLGQQDQDPLAAFLSLLGGFYNPSPAPSFSAPPTIAPLGPPGQFDALPPQLPQQGPTFLGPNPNVPAIPSPFGGEGVSGDYDADTYQGGGGGSFLGTTNQQPPPRNRPTGFEQTTSYGAQGAGRQGSPATFFGGSPTSGILRNLVVAPQPQLPQPNFGGPQQPGIGPPRVSPERVQPNQPPQFGGQPFGGQLPPGLMELFQRFSTERGLPFPSRGMETPFGAQGFLPGIFQLLQMLGLGGYNFGAGGGSPFAEEEERRRRGY